MPTPITFSEENYHLLHTGELVFLDASGTYRNVLYTDPTVKNSGTVGGVNLTDTNRLAILVTYYIDDKRYREFPELFLRDEVEREQKEAEEKEIKAAEERLIILRATRKVLEKTGGSIDNLVDIEIEGTALCKRLDEIDPIFETIETKKNVATGGLFSYIRTVTDTETTFKSRIF
jgi:hypothetical protein